MKALLAVTVLVLFAQASFAQSGSSARNAIQGAIGNSSASGVVQGAMGGSSTTGTIQGQMMEPSSVISGEVIQSDGVYNAPMADGTVMADSTMMSEGTVMSGDAMYSSAPMASSGDCGCGGGAAPAAAPVVTYSSAPVAVPAASPCCPAPRRGFFRTLFGR